MMEAVDVSSRTHTAHTNSAMCVMNPARYNAYSATNVTTPQTLCRIKKQMPANRFDHDTNNAYGTSSGDPQDQAVASEVMAPAPLRFPGNILNATVNFSVLPWPGRTSLSYGTGFGTNSEEKLWPKRCLLYLLPTKKGLFELEPYKSNAMLCNIYGTGFGTNLQEQLWQERCLLYLLPCKNTSLPISICQEKRTNTSYRVMTKKLPPSGQKINFTKNRPREVDARMMKGYPFSCYSPAVNFTKNRPREIDARMMKGYPFSCYSPAVFMLIKFRGYCITKLETPLRCPAFHLQSKTFHYMNHANQTSYKWNGKICLMEDMNPCMMDIDNQ